MLSHWERDKIMKDESSHCLTKLKRQGNLQRKGAVSLFRCESFFLDHFPFFMENDQFGGSKCTHGFRKAQSWSAHTFLYPLIIFASTIHCLLSYTKSLMHHFSICLRVTSTCDALTCRVRPLERALCARLSDKLTPHLPAAMWPDSVVCVLTWGCLLSLLNLHVYTLTTIGLLSDVREANTSGLVSKTLHKRDRAAPNLGMMLDILCVCISMCFSAGLQISVFGSKV